MSVVPNIYEKPGSPLNVGALCLAAQSINAAGNVDPNSSIVVCDGTTATFTLTLPPALLDAGRTLFIVLNVTASSHSVNITPAGSDTIGGTSTKSLSAAGKFVILVSNGTDWIVVAAN
jgi:hypothetical protein